MGNEAQKPDLNLSVEWSVYIFHGSEIIIQGYYFQVPT
jgi:hypothetical protein